MCVCIHIESTYTESGRMYCIPIYLVYKTLLLPLEPIIRSMFLCVCVCVSHLEEINVSPTWTYLLYNQHNQF